MDMAHAEGGQRSPTATKDKVLIGVSGETREALEGLFKDFKGGMEMAKAAVKALDGLSLKEKKMFAGVAGNMENGSKTVLVTVLGSMKDAERAAMVEMLSGMIGEEQEAQLMVLSKLQGEEKAHFTSTMLGLDDEERAITLQQMETMSADERAAFLKTMAQMGSSTSDKATFLDLAAKLAPEERGNMFKSMANSSLEERKLVVGALGGLSAQDLRQAVDVLGFDVVDADDLKESLVQFAKTDKKEFGACMKKKQAFLDMVVGCDEEEVATIANATEGMDGAEKIAFLDALMASSPEQGKILVTMLDEGSPEERKAVLTAIGACGSEEEKATLMAAVEMCGGDMEERKALMSVLSTAKGAEGAKILVALAACNTAEERTAMVKILTVCEDDGDGEEARQALVAAIAVCSSEEEQQALMQTIAFCGSKEERHTLLQALTGCSRPLAQKHFLKAFASAGSAQERAALAKAVEACTDGHEVEMVLAASAIIASTGGKGLVAMLAGDEEAKDTIVNVLAHSANNEDSAMLAEALAVCGTKEERAALLKAVAAVQETGGDAESFLTTVSAPRPPTSYNNHVSNKQDQDPILLNENTEPTTTNIYISPSSFLFYGQSINTQPLPTSHERPPQTQQQYNKHYNTTTTTIQKKPCEHV
jgi:hypothetical protein